VRDTFAAVGFQGFARIFFLAIATSVPRGAKPVPL
jgi:hypothetical protein